MLFQKKSTKELVRGGTDDTLAPEMMPKKAKKKKEKSEKAQKDGRQASFFRTKTFFGIVCIILGLAVALAGVPVLRAQVVDTVKVVTFAADANAGTIITADMLTLNEVSSYHLPVGTIIEESEAVGKYLRVDAVAGDYVTVSRLSSQYPGDDPYLLELPEGKVAISVPLPDLAQSVSGKLRAGDIIQLFAASANSESLTADAPPELQYVEVLTATYQDGVDVQDGGYDGGNTTSGNTLATITLVVNPRQAATIAGLQKQATLYTALVIRGNDTRKAAALAAQDAYFASLDEIAEEMRDVDEQPAESTENPVDGAEGEEVG